MINALDMEPVAYDTAKPHPSHKMGEWESTTVACASYGRFGQVRSCKRCEGRDVKAGGPGSRYFDAELLIPCRP